MSASRRVCRRCGCVNAKGRQPVHVGRERHLPNGITFCHSRAETRLAVAALLTQPAFSLWGKTDCFSLTINQSVDQSTYKPGQTCNKLAAETVEGCGVCSQLVAGSPRLWSKVTTSVVKVCVKTHQHYGQGSTTATVWSGQGSPSAATSHVIKAEQAFSLPRSSMQQV